MNIDLSGVRAAILEAIQEQLPRNHPDTIASSMQTSVILEAARRKLSVPHDDRRIEQAFLTCLHDLFRSGILAPGFDFCNSKLPFFHLTDSGRRAMSGLSRDPSNPDGYLTAFKSRGLIDGIVDSYLREALDCYNNNCSKSAAVMLGCCAERLVIIFRDELVAGLARQSVTIPRRLNDGLADWKFKTVRDSIKDVVDSQVASHPLPPRLKEAFAAYWVSLTETFRLYRNDAGHPASIDPFTADVVHANFLQFPEFARLVSELLDWVKKSYP